MVEIELGDDFREHVGATARSGDFCGRTHDAGGTLLTSGAQASVEMASRFSGRPCGTKSSLCSCSSLDRRFGMGQLGDALEERRAL
jgi:hypothetical protein